MNSTISKSMGSGGALGANSVLLLLTAALALMQTGHLVFLEFSSSCLLRPSSSMSLARAEDAAQARARLARRHTSAAKQASVVEVRLDDVRAAGNILRLAAHETHCQCLRAEGERRTIPPRARSNRSEDRSRGDQEEEERSSEMGGGRKFISLAPLY